MHIVDDHQQRQVGDGLGFSPIQWQKGDIFLQFTEASDSSGQFLETGLYNFAAGEELPLLFGDESESAIRVLVP